MSVTIPSFSKNFSGPIIIIGFGSIGIATLPLLKRHLILKEDAITIISPDATNRPIAEEYGSTFLHSALTENNYESVLESLIGNKKERAFIINLSTEVSSKDIVSFAAKNNAHYIDTVIEPWPGFYFESGLSKAEQSNYALRESLHELKPQLSRTPTAISCCGANPGMVSWFVKQALLNLASDCCIKTDIPTNREEWAQLMRLLEIKGIHIAEKDSRVSKYERKPGVFMNTWSGVGCIAECLQPAELGWGTNEENLPNDGHNHTSGCKASIYLDAPGGNVKVRTWTPTAGKHFGFLVTHNEAISISDYFTIIENNNVIYRPTCHYAYHPSDDTVDSLNELFQKRHGKPQTEIKIATEEEIVSGSDELGVLLYGNPKGAYWYGSNLSIEQTRLLAPHQNATGMQVSSAVISGIFYALNHPNEGLIEADEMDFKECLETQKGYLGTVSGHYTDWTPSDEVTILHNEDPWQFKHIRIDGSQN